MINRDVTHELALLSQQQQQQAITVLRCLRHMGNKRNAIFGPMQQQMGWHPPLSQALGYYRGQDIAAKPQTPPPSDMPNPTPPQVERFYHDDMHWIHKYI